MVENCIGDISPSIHFHTLQIIFEFENLEVFAADDDAADLV